MGATVAGAGEVEFSVGSADGQGGDDSMVHWEEILADTRQAAGNDVLQMRDTEAAAPGVQAAARETYVGKNPAAVTLRLLMGVDPSDEQGVGAFYTMCSTLKISPQVLVKDLIPVARDVVQGAISRGIPLGQLIEIMDKATSVSAGRRQLVKNN